uniref:Uncharacterized protein n=1 Tax=Oryza glaberrima TaxID=4538 RepID=I1PND6_ORYGL
MAVRKPVGLEMSSVWCGCGLWSRRRCRVVVGMAGVGGVAVASSSPRRWWWQRRKGERRRDGAARWWGRGRSEEEGRREMRDGGGEIAGSQGSEDGRPAVGGGALWMRRSAAASGWRCAAPGLPPDLSDFSLSTLFSWVSSLGWAGWGLGEGLWTIDWMGLFNFGNSDKFSGMFPTDSEFRRKLRLSYSIPFPRKYFRFRFRF